jgi:predicted PurR-regulated permease PerM
MTILGTLWDVFWFFFWTFAFIAYLMVLFSIVADIFRDQGLKGWAKALWILFLVFVPFLTALFYLLSRGDGMAERQARLSHQAEEASAEYIRSVAASGSGSASSASDEIAKAKALHAAGTITDEEFGALKAKALR